MDGSHHTSVYRFDDLSHLHGTLQYIKLLYHLAYLPLLVIFIGMYPFLIAIAQRSFFVFNATEWIWWLIAHMIFVVFMYFCIFAISKLHL